MKIFFAKPPDTSIAARSAAFIERLEEAASNRPDFHTVHRPSSADVVVVDERYQHRTWHYAGELTACDFIRRHAARMCVINHDSYARPFLPGLYVSLERSRPPFVAAVPIPYKWDLWKVPVPGIDYHDIRYLYAFRGTFHTHKVRRKLKRVLRGDSKGTIEELPKALHDHDEKDQDEYIEAILKARFSICPRGISPSSYRLYESMQLGRCPVVISDDWVPPEGPNWDSFVLRISEDSIRHLRDTLLNWESEALDRGRLAEQAWQAHFSWPRRREYFLDRIKDLVSMNAATPSYTQLRELWYSQRFRARYDWTVGGRAKQKLVKKLGVG